MSKLVAVLRLASKGLKLYNPKHDKTIKLMRETADKIDKVGPVQSKSSTTISESPENLGTPNPSPSSSSPGFERTKDYTRKQTLKHLIATEDHLKSDDEDVCRQCLGEKHLPALEQYAVEGKDYCSEECGTYSQLHSIVKKAEEELKGDFDSDVREALAKEFRKVRKEISPSEQAAKEVVEKLS